jgi:adenosylhomocysteine nucleosidase
VIAVTFALPYESGAFRAVLRQRNRRDATPIVVWHTGVGERTAESTVSNFLTIGPRPHALVSLGFAGGLDPALKTGDLLMCRTYSDFSLQQRLADNARLRSATFHTAPTIVETVAAKARLRRETGADAVEMESAGIARACQHRGIPMLAIRAVSDPANVELPVPARMLHDPKIGRPRYGQLGWHLIANHAGIPPFLSFAAGARAAKIALAPLVDDLIRLDQSIHADKRESHCE